MALLMAFPDCLLIASLDCLLSTHPARLPPHSPLLASWLPPYCIQSPRVSSSKVALVVFRKRVLGTARALWQALKRVTWFSQVSAALWPHDDYLAACCPPAARPLPACCPPAARLLPACCPPAARPILPPGDPGCRPMHLCSPRCSERVTLSQRLPSLPSLPSLPTILPLEWLLRARKSADAARAE